MAYQLNRMALERLKALVRAGKTSDEAWSFSVADSNAMLDDPANWTEFRMWHLGVEAGKPTTLTGIGDLNPSKDWYAYPFGKNGKAYVDAIKAVTGQAKAKGDSDIAGAADDVLLEISKRARDEATAAADPHDRNTIWMTSTLNLKAAATDATGKKSLPTFDMVAYTGGAMQLEGWDFPLVVDLAGVEATDKPRPILRDHAPGKVVGHTERVEATGSAIIASGVISGSGSDAKEVVEASANGFPWQASIGAKTLENQFVPKGQTAQANGRAWSGPINIARRTSLREISVLALGADDDTSTRIAAKAAKGSAMKKKFAAWMKAAGFKASDMDAEALTAAKALYKAAMKCEADDPNDEDDDGKDDKGAKAGAAAANITAAAIVSKQNDTADDVLKDIRAQALVERKRMTAITKILDDNRAELEPKVFAEIEAKAIGGEYDLTRTELEVIKARRPKFNAPNINVGTGGQADGTILAAAAAVSYGVTEKFAFKGLDERSGNIAASLKGISLHEIVARSAAYLGIHCHAGGITRDFVDTFLRADKASHREQLEAHQANQQIRAAGGTFSTMSLSGITENILNKMMLEAYLLQNSVVSDIAYERDTTDFKPFKVYRLTASGDLVPLGPTGELANFSLQDESYSNQVTTKGALLVLKREDVVNDDMGALGQASQIVGRKGQLNRERAVMTTFLSGLTTVAPGASVGKTANAFNFWSTGAANYQSGASSALSITSVSKARQQFLQQTDANGDPIGIMPDRLLVGPENEATADNLFNGANLTVQGLTLPSSSSGTSAAQTGSQVVNLNQHKSKYRPLVTPYLGAGSPVTGASATQWALLPNPAGGAATVQVGYYRGQRTPIIKQVEPDANVLGLAYQIIYDFGVALLDYRCGQYSAGA